MDIREEGEKLGLPAEIKLFDPTKENEQREELFTILQDRLKIIEEEHGREIFNMIDLEKRVARATAMHAMLSCLIPIKVIIRLSESGLDPSDTKNSKKLSALTAQYTDEESKELDSILQSIHRGSIRGALLYLLTSREPLFYPFKRIIQRWDFEDKKEKENDR